METIKQENKDIHAAEAESLYDLSMLEEMDDNEYVCEILKIFIKDTPVELKALKDAANKCNAEAVVQKAHKIKGSAGIIQAEKMCILLKEIENTAKAGVTSNITSLIDDTQELYNKIEPDLKNYLQQFK